MLHNLWWLRGTLFSTQAVAAIFVQAASGQGQWMVDFPRCEERQEPLSLGVEAWQPTCEDWHWSQRLEESLIHVEGQWELQGLGLWIELSTGGGCHLRKRPCARGAIDGNICFGDQQVQGSWWGSRAEGRLWPPVWFPYWGGPLWRDRFLLGFLDPKLVSRKIIFFDPLKEQKVWKTCEGWELLGRKRLACMMFLIESNQAYGSMVSCFFRQSDWSLARLVHVCLLQACGDIRREST